MGGGVGRAPLPVFSKRISSAPCRVSCEVSSRATRWRMRSRWHARWAALVRSHTVKSRNSSTQVTARLTPRAQQPLGCALAESSGSAVQLPRLPALETVVTEGKQSDRNRVAQQNRCSAPPSLAWFLVVSAMEPCITLCDAARAAHTLWLNISTLSATESTRFTTTSFDHR